MTVLQRLSQWLFSHNVETKFQIRQIRMFGRLVGFDCDYPMRYGWADFHLNYFDFFCTPYFNFIHGRGYGYSIYLTLLLMTIEREPFRISLAWNPD